MLHETGRMKRRLLRLFSIILLAVPALTGCGYSLAGYSENNGEARYKKVLLYGSKSDLLYQELYIRLRAAGVELLQEKTPDAVTIILSGSRVKRSLSAVDSRSQELQYNMQSATSYSFVLPDGRVIAKKSKFNRTILNKGVEALAGANEQRLLINEMKQQTVDEIFINFMRLR